MANSETFNPGALDLRTKAERQRDEMRETVCKEFIDSYTEHPSFSPNRHMEVIARRHELTTMGVKYMLVKKGIYKSNGSHPQIVISVTV